MQHLGPPLCRTSRCGGHLAHQPDHAPAAQALPVFSFGHEDLAGSGRPEAGGVAGGLDEASTGPEAKSDTGMQMSRFRQGQDPSEVWAQFK
ncbi:hypothetical protein NDU88_004242 [Pleurodeles waltl]|uniref:Uncharacterized protein n=1 Tax=Pleurodeles waltl TaxID=8319 RepID=A0AAV7SIA6_PLEWA|nr:hypothetical protein NDU88_004242 [Pleurodeles waltl]